MPPVTTLPIYGPAAPHADPIAGGPRQDGNRCGRCISVPRYWKLWSGGRGGPPDPYTDLFQGPTILDRELKLFRSDSLDSPVCEWDAAIDLSSLLSPGFSATGGWTLYWGSIDSGIGTLSFVGWIAIAFGLTDIGSPQSTQVYGWPDTQYWNCLGRNTLLPIPADNGGIGFPPGMPTSVIVEPFWP